MNVQCEHEFAMDEVSGQVLCIKCGDLDDEMVSAKVDDAAKDAKELDKKLHENQVDFE